MAKEEIIGSPRRSLVFETVGSIRVKVGDKYYPLNYDKTEVDREDKDSIESKIIITDQISEYESGLYSYPGDGKIIFAMNDGIFYTLDNAFHNFGDIVLSQNENQEQVFTATVEFKGNPPFTVDNDKLINNLNANYIDGHSWLDIVNLISTAGGGGSSGDSNNEDIDDLELNSLKVKNLTFDKISGDIILDWHVNVEDVDLFYDDYVSHGVDIITPLYKLWRVKGLSFNNAFDTEPTSFIDLLKHLFTPANFEYDFSTPNTYKDHPDDFDMQFLPSTENTLNDGLNNMYWNISEEASKYNYALFRKITCTPIINIENIYTNILLSSEDAEESEEVDDAEKLNIPKTSNLYNEVLCNIYILTQEEAEKYNGNYFYFTLTGGTAVPGLKGSMMISEYKETESEEAPWAQELPSIKAEFIVTGVSGDTVFVKTDYESSKAKLLQEVTSSFDLNAWTDSSGDVETDPAVFKALQVKNKTGHVPTEDDSDQEQAETEFDQWQLDVNPDTISISAASMTIIGNLSLVNSSVMSPNGVGIYSDNAWLVNPYIRLYDTVNGVETMNINQHSLNISNGWITTNVIEEPNKQTPEPSEVQPTAYIVNAVLAHKAKDSEPEQYVYRICSGETTHKFGPLVINDDGSATLGTGETQITIDADGTVHVPSAAVN